ncbi:MAG: hypothetical protein KGV59_04290 [Tenacibaculum sp.]|nr:hypothetical protein [Tenacibaculum sp.]
MSNTLEAISSLKSKLEKLISNYNFLKEENEALLRDNTKLLLLLEENKQKLINQKKEYDLLKIAKAINGSNDSVRETKLKVNTLIREIDKCIVQLSS